jgi:hypothetical protein
MKPTKIQMKPGAITALRTRKLELRTETLSHITGGGRTPPSADGTCPPTTGLEFCEIF